MNDTADRVDDAIAAGAADDWLAAFAKKSQEALAKQAAEKQAEPRPDDKTLIEALARKDHAEYDRLRGDVAETLGIRVGTLDDKVEALRAKRTAVRSVTFPPFEPPSFPVDGNALLTSVSGRIRRHIVASEHLFTAAALWAGFAWTHDAYAHSPLLLATSKEPNSGKTTLVELLKLLVPRGLSAVDMTGPTLFRFIEKFNPTFVLDEADTLFRENEQLRVLFNSGWTRGSGVPRINPDTLEPEVFPTFAPKVIGMKGRKLPDTTLGRAIVLEMERKLPGEVVEDFEHLDDAELRMLRGQFARWAADNMESLRQAKPVVPEGFYNRVACNWRPLLAVADLAGGDWPGRARKAAEALTGKEPGTVYAETLAAIKTLFGDNERMFSEDVVRELHAIEGGPWAEWGKSGKPISQNALARLLKPITPEQIRIGHESKKGYERAKFQDAFDRYLPPEPETSPSQPKHRNKCDEIRTSDTFATETAKDDVSDEKCKKPNNDGLCFGVSDGKGVGGGEGGSDHEKAPDLHGLSQPVGVRPATNGKGGPGRFMDAQGKPTDDPELGYYGRAARAPLDAAYQAATEKQPVEKVPPAQPPVERGLGERHTREALMTHVAEVIEEQLRNLDEEAKKAKREADQCVSTPDPAPRQPVLVMQDSKEDAGLPPQVVVPDQAEKASPATDVISAPDPVPARPMLEGDRRRAEIRARNQEALRRLEAEMIRRAERAGVPVRQVQQDS